MIIENYLTYLNEGRLTDWMKDIGLTIKDLYIEDRNCKSKRKSNNFIYLFHGTRPHYVQSIKKNGLLVSLANKRSSEEGDINLSGRKPIIWFSSMFDPNSPEFGGGEKSIKMLIAKLDVNYLKNAIGTTYIYYKDVLPKDIIWDDNPKFLKVINQSKCLRIKNEIIPYK